MPTFIFNKMIRDKLKDEYIKLDHRATYKKLTGPELLEALKQKIIEEVNEIPTDGSKQDMIEELADVQQVLEDIMKRYEIDNKDVVDVKQKKFAKKGGFAEALFVEKVELNDDDEWVAYYRKSPEKYKEL